MAGLLRAWLVIFLAVLWLPEAQANAHHVTQNVQADIAIISMAELPVEARDTLRAIKQGGPFAYQRDGVVFGNFERILPKRPRGYYHEFTVKTPGNRTRGSRRIITGESPGEFYYTADHYNTFNRIRE
jgi:ribonuclease T1